MRKFLVILSAIFLVLTILFLFLPLGTIGVLPGALAIVCALILFFISEEGKSRKTPITILVTAVILTGVILIKNNFSEPEIADDQEFEEKMEQAEEENIEELENELEDLDLEDEFELEDDLELEDDSLEPE